MHTDSDNSSTLNLPVALEIGDDVYVGSGSDRFGKVAFIGPTQFATGEWIGVILTSASGKNDGTVNGVAYFKCEPMCGIFCRRHNIRSVQTIDSDESALEASLTEPQMPASVSTANGSLSQSTGLSSSATTPSLKLGERVTGSNGRVGTLRYLGTTDFATGQWAGIELDEPLGKNDGTVGGRSYFSCKPNHGLFVTVDKVTLLSASPSCRPQQFKRSQESLHSHCSTLSSLSRSYRAQYSVSGGQLNNNATRRSPGTPLYRNTSVTNPKTSVSSKGKDTSSTIAVLQQLVREKEEHINQLLEERDLERSDLAASNLKREQVELQARTQRDTIVHLDQQLESVSNALQLLRVEHEQTLVKLHEERKHVEDLQFRMEEESIDKSTLESRSARDESQIFELEEALMVAREANDRTNAELTRLHEEFQLLQRRVGVPHGGADTHLGNLIDNVTDDVLLHTPEGDEMSPSLAGDIADNELIPLSSSPIDKRHFIHPLTVVSMVSHASIQPTSPIVDRDLLQKELEKLRQKLSEQEEAAEVALKRQADALHAITADYEKQLNDINAQLVSAAKHLVTSKEETQSVKQQTTEVKAEMLKEIENLKTQLVNEQRKHEEAMIVWKNRVDDLTSRLETDKTKWAQASIEQNVATRKLEEKLRLTEKQLMDYQETIQTSAHFCVQKQVEEISSDADLSGDHQALLSQLHVQEELLKSQMDDLASARAEQKKTLVAQRTSDDRIQQMEASLTDICAQLSAATSREAELTSQLSEASASRDQLVSELSALVSLLPHANDDNRTSFTNSLDILSCLKEHIAELHHVASEAEAQRTTLEAQVRDMEQEKTELEEELSQIRSAMAELSKDSTACRSTTEELETARSRMALLELEVANNVEHLSNSSSQMASLQERLDHVLAEHTCLKKAHQDAVAFLEAEKRGLLERVQQAELKVNQKSNVPAASTMPSGHATAETAGESQVAFLNSIIVDLHAKNAELEKQVQCMLDIADVPPQIATDISTKKILRSPRLWCDDCLVFDSHDTKQCPSRKSQLSENGAGKVRIPKRASAILRSDLTRVYCDICGVFDDHQTVNCTDAQTF